jgi:hypothetical protein
MFIPAGKIYFGQTQYMTATLSVQSFPGGSRIELWGFFTPPVTRVDFRAVFVANCFLRTVPPVDLRAVCLVRGTEKMIGSELEGEMKREGALGINVFFKKKKFLHNFSNV